MDVIAYAVGVRLGQRVVGVPHLGEEDRREDVRASREAVPVQGDDFELGGLERFVHGLLDLRPRGRPQSADPLGRRRRGCEPGL